MEEIAPHVSQTLISLADIQSGHTVLDLATGVGEPALAIAKCVGERGQVIATDQAAQMIAIAKSRAAGQGCSHVSFRETDSEKLDFPGRHFDDAACAGGGSCFCPV